MHLAPLIQDLAVILILAGLVSFLFRQLRQPIVLGYLVAGIIAGPHTPPFSFVIDLHGIQVWAELGVIFFMFSLGLEFNLNKLKAIGAPATGIAVIKVFLMGSLSFLFGKALGWTTGDSVFLGAILSVSSTTIVVKAFNEMGLLANTGSELATAVLLVEDVLAVLILVGISIVFTTSGNPGSEFLLAFLKLIGIVAAWLLFGYLLLPRLINYIGARSDDETLILLSLGACLGLVVFAARLHYSSALGAFVMGLIFAESKVVKRVDLLMIPIRDVFAAVFFISVGMLLNPSDIARNWELVLALSVLTLIGKFASTFIAARILRRSAGESVQIGLSLAQIGEFSFIIAELGLAVGVMRPSLLPIAVAVSVLTVFTTPHLIRLSQKF